jgi:phosphatidylinositol-3-phosphatase
MSRFNAALAKGHLARFNMVIPNGCEQGHDPCGTHNLAGQFDAFVRREVRRHPQQPPGRLPGHRPASPPGVYGGTFSHYSLLRTLEDGFGIQQHLRNAARARPISSIWKS